MAGDVVTVKADGPAVFAIVVVLVNTQPFASLIVTEYVPVGIFVEAVEAAVIENAPPLIA